MHPSRSSSTPVSGRLPLLALAALMLGAAPPPADPSLPAFTDALTKPPAQQVKRCGAPVLGMEEVLTPGGMLVLGELHGTREVPAFVGTLACHLASAGVAVRVGVEAPFEEQPALRRYLEGDGSPQARAALVEGAFWHRPYPDGRSSEALVALMETLRGLRAQGLRVAVFAYDAPGQGNARAFAMSRRVLAAHEEAPTDTFVLLGGNVNASTARGTAWDETFTPMGWHLVRAKLPVRALDLRYSQGHAWTCKLGESQSPVCGISAAIPPASRSGDKALFRGPRPFFQLIPEYKLEGFDGIFYVGPLTASPPAVGLKAPSR